MKVLRKAAVLVVLGLILGGPWAAAVETRAGRAPREVTREVRSALDLLQSFWSLLAGAWSKEGGMGDPLGQPETAPPSGVQCDSGAAGDPLGGCVPENAPTTGVQCDDSGAADPLGGCTPGH